MRNISLIKNAIKNNNYKKKVTTLGKKVKIYQKKVDLKSRPSSFRENHGIREANNPVGLRAENSTKAVKTKTTPFVKTKGSREIKIEQSVRLKYLSKINNVLLNKSSIKNAMNLAGDFEEVYKNKSFCSLTNELQGSFSDDLNKNILNDLLFDSLNNVTNCKDVTKVQNKSSVPNNLKANQLLNKKPVTQLLNHSKHLKELFSINEDKTVTLLSSNKKNLPFSESENSGFQKQNFLSLSSQKSVPEREKNNYGRKNSSEKSLNWILLKRIQAVHPNNYLSVLGYRNNKVILNPNVTLQGIRKCLHYLKNVIETKSLHTTSPSELIIVLESSLLNSLSLQYKSSNNKESVKPKKKVQNQIKGVCGSTDLLAYSLLRLQKAHLNKLKITLKSAKETLSYLSSLNKNTNKEKLCGVLMINPAKSLLGNLADSIFNQQSKKMSTGNAIGSLCATKGIPLISLCDIVSPLQFCTYPIMCDTRNIKSIYTIFDLLTYGLNQIMSSEYNK